MLKPASLCKQVELSGTKTILQLEALWFPNVVLNPSDQYACQIGSLSLGGEKNKSLKPPAKIKKQNITKLQLFSSKSRKSAGLPSKFYPLVGPDRGNSQA